MINKPPAFSLSIIMLVVLFLSTHVYAENQPSFTQSHVSINDVGYNNKLSAKEVMRQQLEDALIGGVIDQLFNHELDASKTTGIKAHSSFGLKLRSDETILQFKMRF